MVVFTRCSGDDVRADPAYGIRWHTWSRAAMRILDRWARAHNDLPHVEKQRIRGNRDYAITYAMDLRRVPPALRQDLNWFAQDLQGIPAPYGVIGLTRLFRGPVNGEVLHSFFGALRNVLARRSGSPRLAMYPPPASTGEDEFPLHSDLWEPSLLLNVFDKVSKNGAGASTLLRVSTLKRILRDVQSLPMRARKDVLSCFEVPHQAFLYERLYDLLHNPENAWQRELRERIEAHRIEIPFSSGEGYLIHDRRWLHGRLALPNRASPRRFLRLVFDQRKSVFSSGRVTS